MKPHLLLALCAAVACLPMHTARGDEAIPMKAGFARAVITPPPGTTMMGFGARDMDHGCEGVHDDIFARVLFLEQGNEKAVIIGLDLCFIGREEADRFKGAIGRQFDLLPRQILFNTSHNHVGPAVGTWYSAGYEPADRLYLADLERSILAAVSQAHGQLRDVTIEAGVTHSRLPMNRRGVGGDGKMMNRPNADGPVYDKLPLCLIKDKSGKPVCLLFSISCHPSMMSGFLISAEYPGVAMRKLDAYLGDAVSLFLQGVGGDAKPRVIGGSPDGWAPGTWELMEEAGGMIAQEAIDALGKGLSPVTPELRTGSREMVWPLDPAPSRERLLEILGDSKPEDRAKDIYKKWAAQQILLMDRYGQLPGSVTLSMSAVQLGKGLRIAGIEGEAVHAWGDIIESCFDDGVTFPLGYVNGTGLYLPVTSMLPEGGYEVDSAWEYGLPARLAPDMEKHVRTALAEIRAEGVN